MSLAGGTAVKYPFLDEKRGSRILKRMGVTFEAIDSTKNFDDILRMVFMEITDLLDRRRNMMQFTSNENREVIKFYLTVFLLRYIDSPAVTRRYLAFYAGRVMSHVLSDQNAIIENRGSLETANDLILAMIRDLMPDFKYEIKEVREALSLKFVHVKVPVYLKISSLVTGGDPDEYQSLRLVNRTLVNGSVVFDYGRNMYIYYLIFCKLVEAKIKRLMEAIDIKNAVCEKMDVIKKEILQRKGEGMIGAGIPSDGIPPAGGPVGINYGNSELPPCVTAIHTKFMAGERVRHFERFVMGSFMLTRERALEDVLELFMKASNYKKDETGYQLKHLQKTGYKTPNCDKLANEGCCFADDTCKKYRVKNPLSYYRRREVKE